MEKEIDDLKTREEKYDKIYKFFGENGEELAAILMVMWFIFTYGMESFKWCHYFTVVPLIFLLIGNINHILNLFYGIPYIRKIVSVGYALSFGMLSGYATWALHCDIFHLMTWISIIPVLMLVVALIFIKLSLNTSKQIMEQIKKKF